MSPVNGFLSWWDGVELWLSGLGFVLQTIVVMPVVLALAYLIAVVLDASLGYGIRGVQLVRRIRECGAFSIGVAGFPEGHIACREGRQADWQRLKAKIDEGADFVITQLFFDNRHYFECRDFLFDLLRRGGKLADIQKRVIEFALHRARLRRGHWLFFFRSIAARHSVVNRAVFFFLEIERLFRFWIQAQQGADDGIETLHQPATFIDKS